jgi:hypothetical protein
MLIREFLRDPEEALKRITPLLFLFAPLQRVGDVAQY